MSRDVNETHRTHSNTVESAKRGEPTTRDHVPAAGKNQIIKDRRKISKFSIITNRWLLSVCTVALFVSLGYGLVGLPFYATNDDTNMTAIVSGTAYTDSPDEHNLFGHVYQGLILKHLYLTLPGIPWYGLFQISTLAISMSVITWLILCKSRRPAAVLALAIATLTVTCVRPLFLVQFTTTAALAACAGAFLLIESIERWHLRKRAIACALGAATMLTLAAIIRDDSTNLVLLVTCMATVARLLPKPVRQRRKLIAHLLTFATSFALVFALGFANTRYYENEWKDFINISEAIVTIREYRCDKIDPRMAESAYKSVGWTPTDATLLLNRYNLDESVYSLDKLTVISKLVADSKIGTFNTEGFIGSIQTLLADQAFLPLILPLLLIMPFVDRSKVPLTSWLVIAAGVLSLCTYLLLFMKLPMRVLASLILPLVLFAIRYVSPSKLAFPSDGFLRSAPLGKGLRYTTYGALLLAAVAPSFWLMSQLHAQLKFKAKTERDLRAAIQWFSARSDKLYIDWAGDLRPGVSPFSDLAEIYQNLKIIPLGPYGRTPFTYKRLKDAGIENLLRQLDRDDIVVLSNDEYNRLIRMYAAEKLGKEVVFTRIPVRPGICQAFKVNYVEPADPEKLKRDFNAGFLAKSSSAEQQI